MSINTDPIYMCYKCKKEINKKEGYLCGEGHICDQCAHESSQTFIDSNQFSNFESIEEIKKKIKTFMFSSAYNTGFEDWSQRVNAKGITVHRIKVFKYVLEVNEEPKTDEKTLFTVSILTDSSIRYGGSLWNNYQSCLDELSDYLSDDSLQKYEDMLRDFIIMDEECVSFETYDKAKDALYRSSYEKDDIVVELCDSFLISQQNGRYCFVLNSVMDDPTKFKMYIYAHKDEVATKYMKRQLEECIYYMDRCEYPDDYKEDCATAEEMDEYLKNQDPCFMCGEYNYSNVLFDNGRMRIICRDCLPTVTSCAECETLTKHETIIARNHLCFDCHYKRPESVQKPLEEHLLVRLEIQSLRREHFNVLVDYAELCEFTIFDAYHYKSRCHFYDCTQRISPSGWCAEEKLQFCCRRHYEHADEIGCHCTNVWNGTDYDDEYEQATCRACNSAHEENVKSRVALRESHMRNGPIVSAISAFEELKMSNVLAESLIYLCEFLL